MNLEEKILNDIEKTGFAVELRTVSQLIDNGWIVEHGSAYEDFDENKSREIDVVASKTVYVEELSLRLSFYLIIEIKKASRPWIIFTTDRRSSTLGWSILCGGDNIRRWIEPGNKSFTRFRSIVFGMDAVTKDTPREHELRVGKAFHELEKNPGERSKIYEALIGSSKAAYYISEKYSREDDKKDFIIDEDTDLTVYLPLVILDGLLYEVCNDYAGKIILNKKSYIPVELNYSSPKYRKSKSDARFYPDVIEFNFLTEYLEKIEAWRLSMLKHLSKDLRRIGKKPNKKY